MTIDGINLPKDDPGSPGLRLVDELVPAPEENAPAKQFVNFFFLRVNPEWRRLPHDEKATLKSEFAGVYESFAGDLLMFSYSLVGFDSKADIMLWRIGESMDLIQEMTSRLFRTGLGSYLETADNYLAATRKMMFVEEPSNDRQYVQAGDKKYHFLYACSKTKEWIELTPDDRDALVEENFMVGRRFPNIKIHLTHAFGFNEQEYLVSFETDEPKDFLALAEELRQTQASKYTVRGMPVYTCRQRPLLECLDALG